MYSTCCDHRRAAWALLGHRWVTVKSTGRAQNERLGWDGALHPTPPRFLTHTGHGESQAPLLAQNILEFVVLSRSAAPDCCSRAAAT